MSIQVNNNATVDWSTLLSKLDAATKSAETQGAGGVAPGRSVTITTGEAGATRQITFPVPDDLEMPATVDQAGIDSLCAKLAGDKSLGLTEADVKAVHEALSEALAAASAPLAASIQAGGSKQIFFDLYKLMALLVEVGQKQRDAAREMRAQQNQAIQTSILNQAEQQKAAALTGMIAGAICCAAQVVATGVSLAKQGAAFKQQLGTFSSSGVDSAKQNLNMLETAESPAKAQQQLAKVTQSVGDKPSGNMGRTIAEEVGEFGFTQTDQANAKHMTAQTRFDADLARLQRVMTGAPREAGDVPADSALGRAEARLAKFDRLEQLEGMDNRTPAETTELFNLRHEMSGTTRQQLLAEVENGRATLVGELQTKTETSRQALDTAKADYRKAVKTDLGRYQNEYESALRDVNSIDSSTSPEQAAKFQKALELAGDKLQFARANAYAKLADPAFADAAGRAADIRAAGEAISMAESGRVNDLAYIKATYALNKGRTTVDIISAIGNATQSFINNLVQYEQAETTKLSAEQKKKEEELDQTKDLFGQAQSLVDAVVQLMQAVRSAETQSMRDAIQA